MFSEFELPLGFEDCRTGPPREPRAGRLDAIWNELERELERAGMVACWADTENASQLLPGTFVGFYRERASTSWSGDRRDRERRLRRTQDAIEFRVRQVRRIRVRVFGVLLIWF